MASFAHQNLEQLKVLAKSKNKKSLLKKAPNCVIKALCECCKNLLCGNIPCNKQRLNRLRPYKKALRVLSKSKVPLFKKRRILIQKGEGFLSFLLPTALSVLATLIHGKE